MYTHFFLFLKLNLFNFTLHKFQVYNFMIRHLYTPLENTFLMEGETVTEKMPKMNLSKTMKSF